MSARRGGAGRREKTRRTPPGNGNETMIQWLTGCYVAALGLAVGSFLNVLVYRIPSGIPVSRGRSFCPRCRHRLGAADLFPVLSFLFLRGKCRYCGAPIRFRYPAVELLNAAVYLLLYRLYGLTWESAIYAVAASCLITLALIDFDHKIIPDRFHVILGGCALAAGFLTDGPGWIERLIGFFAVSVPVFLIVLFTGGMGEGDSKLFAVCGFLVGYRQIILAAVLSSVLAAGYGALLMAFRGAGRKTEIAFGPFIAIAVLVCLGYGERIVDWYLGLLL